MENLSVNSQKSLVVYGGSGKGRSTTKRSVFPESTHLGEQAKTSAKPSASGDASGAKQNLYESRGFKSNVQAEYQPKEHQPFKSADHSNYSARGSRAVSLYQSTSIRETAETLVGYLNIKV